MTEYELTEQDIVRGKSDSDILWFMRSNESSLKGEIIDEDNRLFYVDGDLDTINSELKDYFEGEPLSTSINNLISVYYSDMDGELYAIWNN